MSLSNNLGLESHHPRHDATHRYSSEKSLSNKETTDVQLDEWCRQNVPGWAGVIDSAAFPEKYKTMIPGQSIIINLDPNYGRGGTHWVAFKISSEAPIAFYKDSFGGPPPQSVVDAVVGGRGLVYGNRIYQNLSEVNCGKRSAHFLKAISLAEKRGKGLEYFEKTE